MTILAPPAAPSRLRRQRPDAAEALIGEARARQRRRRQRLAAVTLLAAGLFAALGYALNANTNDPQTLMSIEHAVAASLTRSRPDILVERLSLPGRAHSFSPGDSTEELIDLTTGQSISTTRARLFRGEPSLWGDIDTISRTYMKPAGSRFYTERFITVQNEPGTWRSFSSATSISRLTPALVCSCDPFDLTDDHGPNVDILDRRITILGDQTVEGQPALHLRVAWIVVLKATAGASEKPTPMSADFWLSRSTWLPIRETIPETGTVTSDDVTSTFHETSTTDFSWLPRTPTNLARLRLHIPSGYVEQPSPNP